MDSGDGLPIQWCMCPLHAYCSGDTTRYILQPCLTLPPAGQRMNHRRHQPPPAQPIMPNSMDPTRQGDGDFVGWQGPPGMNPRMTGPRGPAMGPGPGMGPMGPAAYGPGMRGPPPNSIGPGPGGPGGPGPGGPGPGMPAMSMGGPGPRQPWTPNTSTPMSYSSSSPGTYGGMMGPPGAGGPPGPGTPIMPSPQDTSSSGADAMFPMMKPVPGGGMPGDFPLSSGPDGPMGGPMGPNTMGPVMNGDGLDGMKNSPANGPGTPRDDGGGMGDYNLGSFGGPPESDLNSRESTLGII